MPSSSEGDSVAPEASFWSYTPSSASRCRLTLTVVLASVSEPSTSTFVKAASAFSSRLVVPPSRNSSLDMSEPLAPAANVCCTRSLASVPTASSISTSPVP